MTSRPGPSSPPLRILVVSTFDGTSASVIRDYLLAFRAHSRHDYFHVFDGWLLDRALDLSSFDVVLVFWSVQLLGPDLSERALDRLRAAPAAKVLFLQDEYRDVRAVNAVMARLGVRVMFTCVAEKDHELFYPKALIPSLEATYTVLPGYVPDSLAAQPLDLSAPRRWDVGYRSRELPFYLGDLAREKVLIAEAVRGAAAGGRLEVNLSTREEERLYGARWVEFLRSCRSVLGTPSGASVVDFDGSVRRACERYAALTPAATYDEVKRLFFGDLDGKVVIETISPRVFEAAALGCALVQYEGSYSGLVLPDVHYVPLRRDHANLGEVADRIRDRAFCARIARQTHADLIASGLHGYRAFARRFDAILAEHGLAASKRRGPSPGSFHLRAAIRHGQRFVPSAAGLLEVSPGAWLSRALGAVSGRIPGLPGASLIRRLAANPLRSAVRLALLLQTVKRVPAWRRLVSAAFRERPSCGPGALVALLDEIDKLELVRRAREGTLRSSPAFDVEAAVEDDGAALVLTSVAGDRGPRPGGPLPSGVRIALLERSVARIVWDHGAVSRFVSLPAPGRRPKIVWVGAAGVRRFDAVARLGRRSPAAAEALLEALEGPRTAPREGGGRRCAE